MLAIVNVLYKTNTPAFLIMKMLWLCQVFFVGMDKLLLTVILHAIEKNCSV